MSQLILIILKVVQYRYCSTGIPQWIGCSSWKSPHTFPSFSNLDISIGIAQLCTEKLPFFQHVLLLRQQCFEFLANIITRVPTSFLKNANLLWPWSSHWVIRTIPRSCQKVHVESTLHSETSQPGKQSAGESHPAQNTRTFHTSLLKYIRRNYWQRWRSLNWL